METKPLIKKIFLFISIFIVIILSLNIFNVYIINKTVFQFDDNVNKLFLGSSTIETAINDELYMNSVNMASSADPYFYSYLKFKRIVKLNPHIDTVFLDISPKSILKNQEGKWLFNKTHFAARIGDYYSLMDFKDFKVLNDHFGSNFYKIGLANITVRSFRNVKEYFIGDLREIYGGYKELHRDKLDEALNRLESDHLIEKNAGLSKIDMGYLDSLIEICKINNVELIFISPPIRKEFIEINYLNYIEFNKFYKEKYSDITFLDFSLLPLPDEAYADVLHLNYSGSVAFSQLLQQTNIENVILELPKFDFSLIKSK